MFLLWLGRLSSLLTYTFSPSTFKYPYNILNYLTLDHFSGLVWYKFQILVELNSAPSWFLRWNTKTVRKCIMVILRMCIGSRIGNITTIIASNNIVITEVILFFLSHLPSYIFGLFLQLFWFHCQNIKTTNFSHTSSSFLSIRES